MGRGTSKERENVIQYMYIGDYRQTEPQTTPTVLYMCNFKSTMYMYMYLHNYIYTCTVHVQLPVLYTCTCTCMHVL